VVKYAIRGRWEGMEVSNNSVCGHHRFGGGTVSDAELTEQMFGREYTPMFSAHGKRYVFRKPLLVSIYKSP
jgi:hypothetical protein